MPSPMPVWEADVSSMEAPRLVKSGSPLRSHADPVPAVPRLALGAEAPGVSGFSFAWWGPTHRRRGMCIAVSARYQGPKHYIAGGVRRMGCNPLIVIRHQTSGQMAPSGDCR